MKEECNHMLILGRIELFDSYIYPDEEPYKDGERIVLDDIPVPEDQSVFVHYCEICKQIIDIWVE